MKWLTILAAAAAFGQTSEQSRTFTFAQTPSPQTMQEYVNLIRSIGETQRVAMDQDARTITVAGTVEQLAFASWAMTELDRPASEVKTLVVRQTTFPDARGATAVRIFHPAQAGSPQETQELVNALRSIAEVQRVVAVSGTGVILARATQEQMALCEWILRELEQPNGRAVREYTYPDDVKVIAARSPAVRLYFAKQLATAQELAEVLNSMRSIAEVQRGLAFTAKRAIVIRGNDEQAALTDWMIQELDQAAPAATTMHETSFRDSSVRTAFLAKNTDLQAAVNRVKTVTGIQRATWAQRPRAIVLRGTPGQIALAEGLLR
jgi:hypothetical protein